MTDTSSRHVSAGRRGRFDGRSPVSFDGLLDVDLACGLPPHVDNRGTPCRYRTPVRVVVDPFTLLDQAAGRLA